MDLIAIRHSFSVIEPDPSGVDVTSEFYVSCASIRVVYTLIKGLEVLGTLADLRSVHGICLGGNFWPCSPVLIDYVIHNLGNQGLILLIGGECEPFHRTLYQGTVEIARTYIRLRGSCYSFLFTHFC